MSRCTTRRSAICCSRMGYQKKKRQPRPSRQLAKNLGSQRLASANGPHMCKGIFVVCSCALTRIAGTASTSIDLEACLGIRPSALRRRRRRRRSGGAIKLQMQKKQLQRSRQRRRRRRRREEGEEVAIFGAERIRIRKRRGVEEEPVLPEEPTADVPRPAADAPNVKNTEKNGPRRTRHARVSGGAAFN